VAPPRDAPTLSGLLDERVHPLGGRAGESETRRDARRGTEREDRVAPLAILAVEDASAGRKQAHRLAAQHLLGRAVRRAADDESGEGQARECRREES
jgi:hypothetical protein